MIVCSCNTIRESEVRSAARRGCPCPDSAYRSVGHLVQCGSCYDHVAQIIDEERAVFLATNARAA